MALDIRNSTSRTEGLSSESVIQRSTATTEAGTVGSTLRRFAADFDVALAGFIPTGDGSSPLVAAMRYAALAPGKRLRPYLVTQSYDLARGLASGERPSQHPAMHVAAAVELVHAFSLVHDDLPAMDDDDVRRGRPSCHKAFDEAQAILAGDALLALAFELLVRHTPNARTAADMVLELADATGHAGMIGGQAGDIQAQHRPPDLPLVKSIHARKTARLIAAACKMGAIYGLAQSSNRQLHRQDTEVLPDSDQPRSDTCPKDIVQRLGRYGRWLGIAFQITDDLLDVTATRATLGKEVGKDAKLGKQTYPSCVGVEQSRCAAVEASRQAVEALEGLGAPADRLHALARFVSDRVSKQEQGA